MGKEVTRDYSPTSIEADDLKPCPFCGERLVLQDDHHGSWFGHSGYHCECATTQVHDQIDLRRWNTRA